MIRWASKQLFAGLVVLAAMAASAAQAADCSALQTGIDREKLIFYVTDGARADKIGAAWYELEGKLGSAAEWLKLAPYRDGDPAEAVMNARSTADFAAKEVARLRAELKTMPEKGPSFPPVFFWPDGWQRLAFAVLDSLELQSKYLKQEADAVAAGDFEEVARIVQARNEDLSGFDKYFAAFDNQMVQLLPKRHPEHWLMVMRIHWHGLFDLYAARDETRDGDETREATLKIIEKLNQLARDIGADVPAFEATLAEHRQNLQPYFETLACDPEKAEAALDEYLQTYSDYAPLARETIDLLREYARIEVDYLNNGPTKEVFERYDAVSFRYEEVARKASDLWSLRAKLLTTAIAGK